MLSPDRVAQASADWIYLPDDAPHVVTDDFTAVAYPLNWDMPTQVNGIDSSAEPADLIAHVNEIVRSWDRPEAAWWVTNATRPTRLEDRLRADEARLAETVAVLAYDLRDGPPDVGDVADARAHRVSTVDDVREWGSVNARAWDQSEPDEETITRAWREVQSGSGIRVLVHHNGRPVSVAGLTVVGDVARLWGGATVAEERRGGAYRAGLRERLRIAHDLGATLALVKGRVETSAPILQRVGFSAFGEERAYVLTV